MKAKTVSYEILEARYNQETKLSSSSRTLVFLLIPIFALSFLWTIFQG